MELFHCFSLTYQCKRDGCGTLISRDLYDGIRKATSHDVNSIYDLISPFVKSGSLVYRSKRSIEKNIHSYIVSTREDAIIACGQIIRFEGGMAELSCLVVHDDYRGGGRGDAILGYMQRVCLRAGATRIFILSTQAMEWFVERGFHEASLSSLPSTKMFDPERNSKIYVKDIQITRELDTNGMKYFF